MMMPGLGGTDPLDEIANNHADGVAIRIAVVSSVQIYLQGLSHLLRAESGIELVATASQVEEAVSLLDRTEVDVVLLDMTADTGEQRGLAALYRLTGATKVKVVVIGVPDRPDEVVACAEAGIAGFVTTQNTFADLVRTVRAASRGEFTCQGRVGAGLMQRLATLAQERRRSPVSHLTARELEIVTLIDSGHSNKEIARRLNIQLTTVKNHVHNILEKLGVQRRSEAAATARWHQMLPRP